MTIIELLPRLVPLEDEAVSAELEKSLQEAGHQRAHRHEGDQRASAADGVDIEAQLPDGTGRDDPGRLPARGDRARPGDRRASGADEAGLELERGYIRVDEHFRTGVPGISAIGDVITLGEPGHPQLAHVSRRRAIAVAERIAGQEPRAAELRPACPACTYCDPEIGSVGLTEREGQGARLRRAGRHVPVPALGRAKIAGETEGS